MLLKKNTHHHKTPTIINSDKKRLFKTFTNTHTQEERSKKHIKIIRKKL